MSGPVTRNPVLAAHEAGHAVVGTYIGVTVTAVRLEGRMSKPHWHAQTDFKDVNGKLQDAILTAAGAAGEILYTGARPRWAGCDFRYLTRAGYTRVERQMLTKIALAILEGPCRKAFAAVTHALLTRDLTGDEVSACVLKGTPIEVD